MPTGRSIPNTAAAALIAAASTILAGCANDGTRAGDSRKIRTVDDAGSVHVSVLSIAPFEEFKRDLQPKFALSEADALKIAVPSTTRFDERVLDALFASVRLAGPSGHSLTHVDESKTVGVFPTTRTVTDTEVTAPGDPTKFALGDAADGRRATSQPSGLPDGSTGISPALAYEAAAALHQYVKTLDAYVEHAAVGTGKAYVAQLQVTLTPLTRDEKYDVYSNISFFDGPLNRRFKLDGSGVESALPFEKTRVANDRADAQMMAFVKQALKTPEPLSDRPLRVLPMFNTDSFESIAESKSLDRLRRFSLALAASLHGVGAAADFDKLNERLTQVVGNSLNSTFTIGRVTDNTIRCRFGAYATPGRGGVDYVMVPQTHNVTVLVIAPDGLELTDGKAHLVMDTVFAQSQNASPLVDRPPEANEEWLWDEARWCGLDPDHKRREDRLKVLALGLFVCQNNYPAFQQVYQSMRDVERRTTLDARLAWADFAQIEVGNSFAMTEFAITPTPPVQPPMPGATLVDDGNVAIATLSGAANLRPGDVRATLGPIAGAGNSVGTVAATDVAVDETGSAIRALFPSLVRMGRTVTPGPQQPRLQVQLYRRVGGSGFSTLGSPVEVVVVAPAKSPVEGIKLDLSSSAILAQANGDALLRVTFVAPAPNTEGHLLVTGADLMDAKPAAGTAASATADAAGFKLSGPGVFDLAFRNAIPGTPISVIVAGEDPSKNAYKTPKVEVSVLPVRETKK